MDLGTVLTFLAAFFICLLLTSTWKNLSKKDRLPPGPTPLPIVGNLLQVKFGEMVKCLLMLNEKYGPLFTVYFGPRRVVVLCGYEVVKEALIDQGDDFLSRGEAPVFDRIFQGYGVGMSNGERWKKLRQFSIMTLRNFGMGKRSLEERIQEEVQYLMKEFKKKKQSSFNPQHLLFYSASNVISTIVFGKRFHYDDEEWNSRLCIIKEGFQLISTVWGQLYDLFPSIMWCMPGPHNRIFQIFEEFKEYISETVKKNKETLDPNNPRHFIDCFLIRMEKEKEDKGSYFDMNNLVLTVLDIYTAGTETISNTITYGLLLLMKYPEIEARLHEEIDLVIGRNRSPIMEDRNNMPYTNAVIHEIQRFSDVVPMGVSRTVTKDTPFRGYQIPKDTIVVMMLGTVLRDPKHFCDPENFNPRNFLDENGEFKKNNAFFPFATGKRMCLGEGLARMELFLVITSILQNFSLKPLVDPKDIDITPAESGFENLPYHYELCVIPR
ncbi:cytochrome P450 2G1 [Microcaecilia unicolor]|uniref:Cytochrome P450 2G1-like n=1 Tax=Microcaecilia unicolor TaxID=1415580 RepID=A0A6P7ZE13_9AMPH|nr:cytochrome P450 2G1-like [Microcaecilia unicolor]